MEAQIFLITDNESVVKCLRCSNYKTATLRMKYFALKVAFINFLKNFFNFRNHFLRIGLWSKTLNDSALAIHQKFREIPFNGFA